MTRPLALLRPEPGWSASAAAARALGLDVVGAPLFVAEPVAWQPPPGPFDALLLGSAAALRHAGPGLSRYACLPVHAVGAVTAREARAAGFAVDRIGTSSLQALLDEEAQRPLRYLRLCGEERTPLIPHSGQQITERVVYRMAPQPLDPAIVGRQPLVALHSAVAARHFAGEVDRLGIARTRLSLLALAPRIAVAAGSGWAAIHIADTPDDPALLAKALTLCK